MINLKELTIEKAHEMLIKKEISVLELANLFLDEIKKNNEKYNVYLTIFDDIEEQAQKAQDKIDSGEADILTGIPISIKDVIVMKGRRSTGGSKILENYVSPYSATVIEKLEKSCPVFLGKVNTDEFAQGASTENSAYGVTKNPFDEDRVSGGSSGGSTASIALNMAMASLGSDTGGSIREPASFCNVVGLKPTYGTVSRYGLMAMASSFDVISPTAQTVADCQIMFNQIKGVDKMDSTSVSGVNESGQVIVGSEAKTIGVPRKFLEKGIDLDVLDNFNQGLEKLKKSGYEIKDIDIPQIEYSLAVYYLLVPAEVSANMARFDGIKYGERIEGENLLETYTKTRGQLLGHEVKRRIMLGTYVLSAGYADQYYAKAWQVRNQIKDNLKKVFTDVDLIALPVAPTPAFKIGEKTSDPIQMYLNDIFTVVANVAGVPAISIPNGFVKREKDLPVGFQLMAPHFGEERLFEVGKKFEKID